MTRKKRSSPGPARAGFTYGYQWSAVQPDPTLRFPMDFGSVRVYPAGKFPASRPEGWRHQPRFILEFPESPARWHPGVTLEGIHREYGPSATGHVDLTRIAVALDWHTENGFDLNPFHLSGRSWGAVKWMRKELNFGPPRVTPIDWMDELWGFWSRIVQDGTQAEWSKAPEALWWLDTQLSNPDTRGDWPDVRRRLFGRGRVLRYEVRTLDEWGNPYDGFTTNNEFHAGEIELPETSNLRDVIPALIRAGYLRPEAPNTSYTIDEAGDSMDIQLPLIPFPPLWDSKLGEGHLPRAVYGDLELEFGSINIIGEARASDIWAWAWNGVVDGTFGGDTRDDDIVNREQGRHVIDFDAIEREFSIRDTGDHRGEAYQALFIARAATNEAVAAIRGSDSGRAVLRLYLQEDLELDEEDAVAHSGDPDQPDIDGGDITTEDHQHWYQYGRLYVTGDEAAVRAAMNRDHFFPAVWFIDDHGGATLINEHGGAL